MWKHWAKWLQEIQTQGASAAVSLGWARWATRTDWVWGVTEPGLPLRKKPQRRANEKQACFWVDMGWECTGMAGPQRAEPLTQSGLLGWTSWLFNSHDALQPYWNSELCYEEQVQYQNGDQQQAARNVQENTNNTSLPSATSNQMLQEAASLGPETGKQQATDATPSVSFRYRDTQINTVPFPMAPGREWKQKAEACASQSRSLSEAPFTGLITLP